MKIYGFTVFRSATARRFEIYDLNVIRHCGQACLPVGKFVFCDLVLDALYFPQISDLMICAFQSQIIISTNSLTGKAAKVL